MLTTNNWSGLEINRVQLQAATPASRGREVHRQASPLPLSQVSRCKTLEDLQKPDAHFSRQY